MSNIIHETWDLDPTILPKNQLPFRLAHVFDLSVLPSQQRVSEEQCSLLQSGLAESHLLTLRSLTERGVDYAP